MNKIFIKISLLLVSLSMGCSFPSVIHDPAKQPDFFGISGYIHKNDISAITKYLEEGGDANFSHDDKFLLGIAIEWDRLEIAELLIKRGAKVNGPSTNSLSSNPLWLSLKYSPSETELKIALNMAPLLLKNGASPEIKAALNSIDRPFCIALSLRSSKEVDELVALFIEKGANVKENCNNISNLDLFLREKLYQSALKAIPQFSKTDVHGLLYEIFRNNSSSAEEVDFVKSYFNLLPQDHDWAGSMLIRAIHSHNRDIIKAFDVFQTSSGFFDRSYQDDNDIWSANQLLTKHLKQEENNSIWLNITKEIQQILIGFGMKADIPKQEPKKEEPKKPTDTIPIKFGVKPAKWDTELDPVLKSDLAIWQDPKIKNIPWWKDLSNSSDEVTYLCQQLKKTFPSKSAFLKTTLNLHPDKFNAYNKPYDKNVTEFQKDKEDRFLYNMMSNRWTALLNCF